MVDKQGNPECPVCRGDRRVISSVKFGFWICKNCDTEFKRRDNFEDIVKRERAKNAKK